uniref:hypothetical protein n=1 Tax=Candidatus Limisoma sp. TaxID=3076476 RepID=UPI004024D034
MATVAYQDAKRNSTVFRRLYTAYSFWTAGDMATHQIPFQDANQMAGFVYHHADMSLYKWHITQQRKGQSFVNITDGKCGGNRGALDIPVSPHSVVIADRGYCDFSLLDN